VALSKVESRNFAPHELAGKASFPLAHLPQVKAAARFAVGATTLDSTAAATAGLNAVHGADDENALRRQHLVHSKRRREIN